jgi:hypothetical protein
MRRGLLICIPLVSLALVGAPTPAQAAKGGFPSSQRLAELIAKAKRARTTTTPTTAPRIPSTTSPIPTTATPRTSTPKTAVPPTPTTTTPTTSGSGSSAAKEIEAQLRAVEGPRARRRGAHGSSRLSGAALVLAIVGGLLALAAVMWAGLRFAVVEPHWLLSMRHSLAEAGFRAAAVWSELADWARLGH